MTIAAVWKEQDFLFVAADTRLTRLGETGLLKTTDAGAKIYPLLVECRAQSGISSVSFSRRYGIVFAGNVTLATQAIATITSLCQALLAPNVGDRPSLRNVVDLFQVVTLRYARDLRAVTANLRPPSLVEILVFGLCPLTEQFEVYKLADTVVDGAVEVVVDLQPSAGGQVTAIGSQTGNFFQRLETFRTEHPGGVIYTPRIIIGRMVAADRNDVGGSVSIAHVSRFDFTHPWTLHVDENGQSKRVLNGFDLDEIGPVGPAMVGRVGFI